MALAEPQPGWHYVGSGGVEDYSICCCCCRANAQQPKLFVGMVLILIFAEALALYGLIGELYCAFIS